jgi:hypothetical protein
MNEIFNKETFCEDNKKVKKSPNPKT